MGIVSQNLRKHRTRTNYTQESLASDAQISASYYSALENGRKIMHPLVLLQIADVLKTSTDSILRKPDALQHLDNIVILLKEQPVESLEKIEAIIRVLVTAKPISDDK